MLQAAQTDAEDKLREATIKLTVEPNGQNGNDILHINAHEIVYLLSVFFSCRLNLSRKWQLLSSADIHCKQFGPRHDKTSGLIWIQTVMVFQKDFVYITIKIQMIRRTIVSLTVHAG